MNVTRRTLLSVAALLPLGLAACGTTPTPANVTEAITALNGVIASVKAEIAAGGLNAADYAAAGVQVTALQAQVDALTAGASAATQSTISGIFTTVTGILGQLGQWLPMILPIIGMLAVKGTAPVDTPAQARLRAQYEALRAAAGK
jgi:hypothetical protein